ncbi:MAG: succinate-semialdehyde dehydrogenase / glutarate-semialdehyde dehydrogenase [Frankiaceae bacterium]|nr:succinate-semialdehyde dehydrogenase / glutarate-semialdehyde dehydrogenase [Frankiaceae bacterium]
MADLLSQLFINGEWSDAASGVTFGVDNPATGETLTKVADAGREDMQRAIDAAAAAQPAWGTSVALERSQIMRRAATVMRADIDHLARVMTLEQGKPLDQSRGELEYGIGFIEWFAEEARRIYGMTIPATSREKRITVIKQPLGVTAAITPWNFPSLQILRKLGAALAAGCTMVVKPAELTPLSALEIGRCFHEAGLPKGVLAIVPGLDPVPLAAAIMEDARVRAVSFTGSTEVGKLLMRGAAETMKRVSLELGGHAPLIVFADADLDHAVDQTVAVKMRNMGQTCVSANRIFVQAPVVETFTQRLVERLQALKVGNGVDPGVGVGPLVEDAALDKVERHVADARAKGATVVLGGERVTVADAPGRNFYAPTVLTGVNDTMDLTREETFGPVAAILPFDDEADVIARANDTVYGLAAYFFTRDVNRVVRMTEALDYGTVGVNDASISAVQAPFGGVKESGIGREGGPLGVDEYVDVKYVSLGGVGG